ncbi:MAG: HEAT repeat domain-containing protein [Myxococcaceae bacterium]|nr:HEAT repeat domain-containing protein [Myxococcaceae bacterium]
MGLFDFFTSTGPEKALKLKPKVTQKYGDPTSRQKAISTLGEMGTPEAVAVLLYRFTINVTPDTTDAFEKDTAFQAITALGADAVTPVKEFLRKSDQATSWALRLLTKLVTTEETVESVCELLSALGAEYTRDPEKKVVLLHFLEDKQGPRIGAVVAPFLQDMSDDVKFAAIKVVAAQKHEPAREALLELLVNEDTARRVQTAAIQALHDTGFSVQGFREKVESRLSDPWFVDKSGQVKKRG